MSNTLIESGSEELYICYKSNLLLWRSPWSPLILLFQVPSRNCLIRENRAEWCEAGCLTIGSHSHLHFNLCLHSSLVASFSWPRITLLPLTFLYPLCSQELHVSCLTVLQMSVAVGWILKFCDICFCTLSKDLC